MAADGRPDIWLSSIPRDHDIPGLPIVPFIGVEFIPK
jgi:hypothetical protein